MSDQSHPDLKRYTIRNVKTFIGMEGRGFNATLCRDGKPVAFVIDDGNGGCLHFRWTLPDRGAALAALSAQIPHSLFEGLPVATDIDHFLCRLVDEYEHDKKLRRIAKKKTLFRVKGDEPDTWRTLNVTGDKAIAYLANKYGDRVEAIYGKGSAA